MGMNLKAEIASLEKAISARTASKSKRAIDDTEIKNKALSIKDEDASVLSQIKALEKELAASEEDEKIEADQNDDAMNNNPLADEKEIFSDDDEGMDLTASDDDEFKADEDEEVKADDDEEVKADDDEITASDDGWDDEIEADEDEEIVGGVEDDISDTNDQVIEEVKPEAKAEQPIDVVASRKSVFAKQRYASILKQATSRLDRVAAYLEKNGNSKLAFRIDSISDAIEAKLNK